jgi:FMN-dependent NADH-azoreductase
MAKVLYIKANPKSNEESRTFRISEHFINEYKKAHPEDEIIELDLYKENIHFLTHEDIDTIMGPNKENLRDHPILKYTYQFMDADKYVIATPMWNLGVPAILKAYFDYVSVTGLTFKYTDNGPVGLLMNKKAVVIMTTGGEYLDPPYAQLDFASKYVTTMLRFFGVEEVSLIAAQRLDIIGEDVEKLVSDAQKKAEELAKTF